MKSEVKRVKADLIAGVKYVLCTTYYPLVQSHCKVHTRTQHLAQAPQLLYYYYQLCHINVHFHNENIIRIIVISSKGAIQRAAIHEHWGKLIFFKKSLILHNRQRDVR